MREATEHQFREILEQHDSEFLRNATNGARRMLREQEFDRRFHEIAKGVIKPVMSKARDLMSDHGLRAETVLTKRRTEANGKVTPSSIAFEFRVLTDAEVEGFPLTFPALAFIADPASNGVLVHENSVLPFIGGHIGVIDRCSLDELTIAFVEKHLLAVTRKVLPGTGVS